MADAYVPSGYWSVDVPSVQVRARNHARPGKGEMLLDLSASSSSSSSSGGTYVFVLCVYDRRSFIALHSFYLTNRPLPQATATTARNNAVAAAAAASGSSTPARPSSCLPRTRTRR